MMNDPTYCLPVSAARRTLAPGPIALVLWLLLLSNIGCTSQMPVAPKVLQTDEFDTITVSPGVELKELTGRSALPAAQTERASVALFRLAPGRASHWSYNREGEESFFILKGRGSVWIGTQSNPVRAGSFIVVPPSAVRSIRASDDEALEFYAITTPAWHQGDDVLVDAPAGAPGNAPGDAP